MLFPLAVLLRKPSFTGICLQKYYFIFLVVCFLCLLAAPYINAQENGSEIQVLKAQYTRPLDIPYPEDNPYSEAKAELGKMLFFDPRLSASGTQSCATCHNPGLGWEDGMALGTGHGHKKLKRTSPTILNLAWDDLYFWDGRAENLEAQALMPIESSTEMHMTEEDMIGTLNDLKGYSKFFAAAFPEDKGKISKENVAKAIATFERGIVSDVAPFDRWIKGDEVAISESAKRGFVLFNKKANCAACHAGWRFSDSSFHDIGLDSRDIGRGEFVPQIISMQHAFKTVGLRNIAQRAPYMHNGSLKTLEDVIDHYDHGFIKRDSLSDEIKPLNLTSEEKNDLINFLKTLTSEDPAVTVPVLPK